MKLQNIVKNVSFGIVASGFMWSNLAFAQTNPTPPAQPSARIPVSTSMHLSGSCAKCDLSHRIMPGISLQGANFTGTDFSHSNLSGADFNQANLNDASFYKAYLFRVTGTHVNLNKAVLRGTALSDVQLISSHFVNADLQKADMTGGNFAKSDFTKARLKHADAIGAIFIAANFTNAKLSHADFTGANFTRAQFTNTKFGNAILDNAKFTNADLSGAEMSEVTGLTQEQLDKACGSKTTQLPYGFSMKVCTEDTMAMLSGDSASEMTAYIQLQQQIVTDAKISEFGPRIMLQILPSTAPRNLRRGRMVSIRSSELDDIMSGIDVAIGVLPMNSPSRTRLEKSKRKLEAFQATAD